MKKRFTEEQSIRILGDAMASFERYCARGIEPNIAKIEELMSQSLMLVTALSPHIGYDRCATIAKSAYNKNISLREAAIESGFVTGLQFDSWVIPKNFI